MEKLRVAIVGCGDISHPYAKTIGAYDFIEIRGAFNPTRSRAEQFTALFGGKTYPSLESLLADDQIDLIVNLTTQKAHAEIIRKCLQAGKHVHTEKPLAMTYQEAQSLAELARAKGLRLSCSPITFMGEAEQTIWKHIRDGKIGKIRAVYAEVNWDRLENWHPNPEPFYEVGAHYDCAVYPLTIITSIFGPAQKVMAYGKVLYPERTKIDGQKFRVTTPDFTVALIEFNNGPIVRLSSNFYISWDTKQRGIEFHGDEGSLYLSSWERFDADIEYARFGEEYTPLPYIKKPFEGIEWARALTETLEAIQQDRPHRSSAEQAVHVVEILNAMDQSMLTEKPVELHTSFTPPEPMEWAQ